MREVNLRSIDLNLLVVLEALLAECNVTRAAKTAGMSQPAMSRALGRLRALIGDPLLARGPQGLVPTPVAVNIQSRLKSVLADIRGLVAERDFDPSKLAGTVTFAATDHQTILMLPRLMKRLSREAPRLDVRVTPVSPLTNDQVLAGAIDLGFGVAEGGVKPPLLMEPLYRDRFVTILRDAHPALVDWGLEQFLQLDHVLVTIIDDGKGATDARLEAMGRTRRIALRIPHFFAAISIVAQSDLVVTIPETIARWFAADYHLAVLPPPLAIDPFTVVSFWTPARDADPANQWLRSVVRSVARDLPGVLDAVSR